MQIPDQISVQMNSVGGLHHEDVHQAA